MAATMQPHLKKIPTCRQQSKAAPEHEQAQPLPKPVAGCTIPTQGLRLQGLLLQAAVIFLSLSSLPQSHLTASILLQDQLDPCHRADKSMYVR